MKLPALTLAAILAATSASASGLAARGLDDADVFGDYAAPSRSAWDSVRRDDSDDPWRRAGPDRDRCRWFCDDADRDLPAPPPFVYKPPVKPRPAPYVPAPQPEPIPLPVPGLLLLGALAGLGAMKARRP